MTEAFLHHLFDSRKLGQSFQTTLGEKMEILSFGQLNKSSGPDFLEAMIQFDNKVWAGHIEFHLKSSDWLKHGHQNDAAYGNVIAHFVLEHDQEIFINNFKLPVVELKEVIDSASFKHYEKWIAKKNWIPCEKQLSKVNSKIVQQQLEIAAQQRIERKSSEAIKLLKRYGINEKLAFYHLVSKCLGGRYNQEAMSLLYEKIEFSTLQILHYKEVDILNYLNALSGLDQSSEAQQMISTYGLIPMDKVQWRTFGMHPPGRPENRIKELARLLSHSQHFILFEQISEWRDFLSPLSKSMQDNILINAVYPLLHAKNYYTPNKKFNSVLKTWLQQLDAENNKLISQWKNLGVKALNAADSQSLIELKNEFCSQKKCLFCGIGKSVLAL